MAATPSQKNPTVISKNFKDKLAQRTAINNFDRDSKSKAIINALQEELSELRASAINSFQAHQLSNAAGEDLVLYGESYGIPVLEQSFATVEDTELNLAFYVESGNFGSINDGASIPLTEGTKVWSSPNNNELGATIKYQLTKPLTLLAGESIAYASAKAVISGDVSNVGQSVLRNHDFRIDRDWET